MTDAAALLLAYFLDEHLADGEEVRFAVSDGADVTRWTELPIRIRSEVGERGLRDPFLIRRPDGGAVVIATDLRVFADGDWSRAVTHGSRAIAVSTSDDLVTWSAPRRTTVAPPEAGNAWAPKGAWEDDRYVVRWASALYGTGDRHPDDSHQRILRAESVDLEHWSDPVVELDPGRDVIDAQLVRDGDAWHRFSVPKPEHQAAAGFPRHERGSGPDADDFTVLADAVGDGVIARGEGPAVAQAPDGRWLLLVDEFGLSGYHLFAADSLDSGDWREVPDVRLPEGARHGSLLRITAEELERLSALARSPR